MTKRKSIALGVGVGVLLLIGVPTLAFSGDFRDKAQAYYETKCSQPAKLNQQTSMACYLFDKVGEIDRTIAGLSERVGATENKHEALINRVTVVETDLDINATADADLATEVVGIEQRVGVLENAPIPTPVTATKQLFVYDADDNKLGLLIGGVDFSTTTFYHEGIDRLIDVGGGDIQSLRQVVFESSDCTGTPFFSANDNTVNNLVNRIVKAGPGRYFAVNPGTTAETINNQSVLRMDSGSLGCFGSIGTSSEMRELHEVSLGITEPIAYPLDYRYE